MATTVLTDGYHLEVAIPLSEVENFEFTPGRWIGLDVALNDLDSEDPFQSYKQHQYLSGRLVFSETLHTLTASHEP